MIEQHWGIQKLADRLGLAKSSIHRAITEGRLSAVSFGHRLLIPESAIEAYLDAHRLGPPLPARKTRQTTPALS